MSFTATHQYTPEVIKGSELQILLKRKKITQKDLIKHFNISPSTVSGYMTNRIAMPATFIIRVAAIAGLSIDDLIIGGQPKTTPQPIPITKAIPQPYKIDADIAQSIVSEPETLYNTPPSLSLHIGDRKLVDIVLAMEAEIKRLRTTISDISTTLATVLTHQEQHL